MSVLIRCKVIGLLFRSSALMEKKVNFILSPQDSEGGSSKEEQDEIKNKIKHFIPVLTEDKHKGSCGRIGIIGGSSEYTGAPYFAGIAAMKLGADLVHVFCCKEAGIPIKCYSPDLMVHPILDTSDVVKTIEPWLNNLHALVIGPGLGKNPAVLNNVAQIITFCKNKKKCCLPLVIDADGLHLVSESPELIKDYNGPIILTPNANEFHKLTSKMPESNYNDLAAHFNAIIVKKGPKDLIQNGVLINLSLVPPEESLLVCGKSGSYRRCGGQGDILSGFIGTFVAWYEINLKSKKLNYNFHHLELSNHSSKSQWENFFRGYSYAAYGGCLMARSCSEIGFRKFGRSLITNNIIEFIGEGFAECFEH